MRDYAQTARSIGADLALADFAADMTRRMAIERALEIVGEAANRVPVDYRAAHREIPWAQIIGMRNALAHGYDAVRLEILFQTVQEDLGPLITQLELLIAELQAGS